MTEGNTKQPVDKIDFITHITPKAIKTAEFLKYNLSETLLLYNSYK